MPDARWHPYPSGTMGPCPICGADKIATIHRSPTMPDTPLTPAYVHGAVSSALYEYDIPAEAARHVLDELDSSLTRYIDALTAAVSRAVDEQPWDGSSDDMRAAVHAILRGEQPDPDAEAEAEFLKPIKP